MTIGQKLSEFKKELHQFNRDFAREALNDEQFFTRTKTYLMPGLLETYILGMEAIMLSPFTLAMGTNPGDSALKIAMAYMAPQIVTYTGLRLIEALNYPLTEYMFSLDKNIMAKLCNNMDAAHGLLSARLSDSRETMVTTEIGKSISPLI